MLNGGLSDNRPDLEDADIAKSKAKLTSRVAQLAFERQDIRDVEGKDPEGMLEAVHDIARDVLRIIEIQDEYNDSMVKLLYASNQFMRYTDAAMRRKVCYLYSLMMVSPTS